MMHVAVLGAGLAGLAAAYELSKAGVRVTLIEKEPHVGGMASSWRQGEFWLDHGPHRFHSRDERLVAHLYEVLDDEVVLRTRRSRIHLLGKYFDYPLRLSNVLSGLPVSVLLHAAWDYAGERVRRRLRPRRDEHFEDWVLARFGRTLYDLFFGTYTSKAWGMPCTQISADWAAQRIAQANLWDAIKKTVFPPRAGEVRSLVTEFWYPARGGIGRIATCYAEKIRAQGGALRLGTAVERVELSEGAKPRVHVDGEVLECDHVVSTIPLPRLLEAIDGAVGEAERAAIDALHYIGIVFVYLEVPRASVIPDHWIYLPSKELRVHRISEFKNFSDNAAPGDATAVCCEITCRPGDATWQLDLDQAAALAVRDLEAIGLLRPGEARPLDIARLPYAYPVYDLTYRENLQTLRAAVRRYPILTSTGRQGLFRYNNMDHSIAMGRKAARSLLTGEESRADSIAAGQEYFG
jgi:protoporphyrinogen oxidase